jgi:hypothetical protein
MIPRDQQERIVATLIAQTQSGALNWTSGGAHSAMSALGGNGVLEAHADGIIFRLFTTRVGMAHSDDFLVTLEIVDEQNSWDKEVLHETTDLSILNALYRIASTQSKNLQKKLSVFLGKKAG